MILLFLTAFSLLTSSLSLAADSPLITDVDLAERIRLPAGFEMKIFARGLFGPRFMSIGPDGQLYVSMPRMGTSFSSPRTRNDSFPSAPIWRP